MLGEPCAAELDGEVGAREGGRPPASGDAVAGLEDEHPASGVGEVAGGAQAGEAGPDDDDVVLCAGGHEASLG